MEGGDGGGGGAGAGAGAGGAGPPLGPGAYQGAARAARLRARAAAAKRSGLPGVEAAELRAAREALRVGAGPGAGGGAGDGTAPPEGAVCDVRVFREVAARLHELAGGEGSAAAETELQEDLAWADAAQARGRAHLAELEAEAGRLDEWGGRGRDGREAMWRALVRLAGAHQEAGDLESALRAFGRAQEFCVSAQRQHELYLLRVRACLAEGNYLQALNYVHKADSLPRPEQDPAATDGVDPPQSTSLLRALAGVAHMASGKFRKAALSFSQVTIDPEDLEANPQNALLPADLAVYGALSALEALNRQDFAQLFVENVTFQAFLDRSPMAASLVHDFHFARYPAFLVAFEAVRGPILGDLYLHDRAEALLKRIRRRALCQYAQPFLRLRMSSMAETFGMSEDELRDELEALIIAGHMKARMDTCEGILLAQVQSTRQAALDKALEVGAECEQETKTLLQRATLTRHGLVSRQDGRDAQGARKRDIRDFLPSLAGMET